jgi:4-amino-4-deoxy-L-arabinose transferase-like glycosyltransferase
LKKQAPAMLKYLNYLKESSNTRIFIIVFILLVGAFLRFYKLDWGEGYFFHPDEYHITIAVNRLSFPTNLNPELYSYGSFTVYLIYFTKIIFNLKSSTFLIGRFYSALFSTLSILAIYKLSKELFKNTYFQISVAILISITPGLIQQAHFATPESTLTFWLILTMLFWIKWLNKFEYKNLFLSAVLLGLAMATKITAIVFLPLLMVIPFLSIFRKKVLSIRAVLVRTLYSLLLSVVVIITVFTFFPYAILDWKSLLHSMRYETAVGSGTQIVFYTRQFINTIPLFFQFQKILPYALGLSVLVFGTLGLALMVFEIVKAPKSITKKIYQKKLILLIGFSVLFFPNAVLYAKWTRFIAPTFPFFALFSVYLLRKISTLKKLKFQKSVSYFLLLFTLTTSALWTIMFFSIYKKSDIRISATKWVNENAVNNSRILTESGNTLEVPLSGNIRKNAFDFYHLDEKLSLQKDLVNQLEKSDYFIIQSRRIFANHQRLPNSFPVTARFYNNLFSGQLGYEHVKTLNSFPELVIGHWSLVTADETSEETWSVFDHPVIRIYKKTKPLSTAQYEALLKI